MDSKENLLRTIFRDKPEWVPNQGDGAVRIIRLNFTDRPASAGTDSWGTYWSLKEELGTGTFPERHPLKNLDDLDSLPTRDSEKAELTPESKAILENPHEDYLIMGWNELCLFERSWLLLGMEEFMVALLTEPEKVKRLIRGICDIKIILTRKLIEAGAEVIWLGDDWGMEKGPFINPEKWREFIKPELARLYEVCKRENVIIYQHSCGKVEEFIPDLVELGAHIWNPCQPRINDLAGLKKRFGEHITFWGGIDSRTLDLGTPEEVRKEVKLRIDEMAPGGGYIAAPSHGVPFKPENIEAMNEAISLHGRNVL